jgi:glycosyltransferase involved in cell wall biosynthesis
MKRPTVLFVENCDYEGFPIGGQHSFIRAILPFVTADVKLVGISTKEEPIFQWMTKHTSGVERPFFAFRRVRPGKIKPVIPSRILMLSDLLKVKNRLLECNPAVVYAQSAEAALPFVIGKRRVPVVFRLAGANNPLSFSRFRWGRISFLQKLYEKQLLAKVVTRADSIIAINDECEKLCARLRNGLPPNWIRLPLGVNMKVFHPVDRVAAREKLGISQSEKVITCVGKLAHVKGLDLALEAFQRLREKMEVRLFLVGEGEERAFLETDATKRGILKDVVFWGGVSHVELPGILHASDVFFMPSLAEGLPNALLEAMACGLPTVVSSVGGIPEVVQDGVNGFLLKGRDPIHAAKQLEHAIDASDNLRAEALRTIGERYSVESIAQRINDLFLKAAKKIETVSA